MGNFFTLAELAQKWQRNEREILDLAADDRINLCVIFDGYIVPSETPINDWELSASFFFFLNRQNLVLQVRTSDVTFFIHSEKDVRLKFLDLAGNTPYVFSYLTQKSPVFSRKDLLIHMNQISQFEKSEEGKKFLTSEHGNNTAKSNLALILDEHHPWHSEPLAIAVRAWLELYFDRDGNKHDNQYKPKSGGHTKLIDDWLTAFNKNIPETTKAHYRFIINPDKKTGPAKLPE